MKKKRKSNGDGERDPLMTPEVARVFETMAKMRASIADARIHMPPIDGRGLDFDGYERRIGEIEQLVHRGGPRERRLALELHENLQLDIEADTAAMLAGCYERLVGFTDEVARRAHEKRFELTETRRDGLDSILLPNQDGIRDQMLAALPIETRNRLESEREAAGG